MHSALPACPQPLLVRSLQLVEVRPYADEEEDFMLYQGKIPCIKIHTFNVLLCN